MTPYRIIGVESSPYAVKVRAVFRYRRLPLIWVARMPQFFDETAEVKPLIMPVVQYPEGEYRTDSTPIILDLEERHSGERSVLPEDAGDAFLSLLIEDFSDEWLTKCLFHNRFSKPEDQWAGAAWVMDDAYPGLREPEYEAKVTEFAERQIERRELVGSTPENAALLEPSLADVLAAMEGFVATDRFLFGSRPSLADFGLYAQLSTILSDPSGGALCRAVAPRTVHWVKRAHDLSGVEGEWRADGGHDDGPVRALLAVAGEYYLPYLAANRRAIEEGEPTFHVKLSGQSYRQPVFRYQAKCHDFLVRQFAGLPDAARDAVEPILAETGCLPFLQAPGVSPPG